MLHCTTPVAMNSEIYNFPPFFTRQPNETTWQAQLSHWKDVILSHSRETKLWKLSNTDGVFENKKIQRRLKPDVIQLVLADMVSSKKADWVDSKTKTEVWVWWRSAEEWATLILGWIDSTGQNGSIVTFYDIAGDDNPGVPEMVGMDSVMLHKVCQVLANQGKAAIMRDEEGNEVGLKV